MTDPIPVLREVGRVLKLGTPVVITFSNRYLLTKAFLFITRSHLVQRNLRSDSSTL